MIESKVFPHERHMLYEADEQEAYIEEDTAG